MTVVTVVLLVGTISVLITTKYYQNVFANDNDVTICGSISVNKGDVERDLLLPES